MTIEEGVIWGVILNWLYWFVKMITHPDLNAFIMMWICAIAVEVFIAWLNWWRNTL